MSMLQISLTDRQREFVDAQVKSGQFADANAYVQALVKQAQRREARSKISELLLEGLNSGEPIEATPAFWNELQVRYAEPVEGGAA